MGFLGPEKTIVEELQLAQDPRSNIETPKSPYTTAVPKVYAAGGESIDPYWPVLSDDRLVTLV